VGLAFTLVWNASTRKQVFAHRENLAVYDVDFSPDSTRLVIASTRQTTLVEDAAHSLVGIFSVAGIPAMYGEGNGSLGRLLANVLTASGDE